MGSARLGGSILLCFAMVGCGSARPDAPVTPSWGGDRDSDIALPVATPAEEEAEFRTVAYDFADDTVEVKLASPLLGAPALPVFDGDSAAIARQRQRLAQARGRKRWSEAEKLAAMVTSATINLPGAGPRYTWNQAALEVITILRPAEKASGVPESTLATLAAAYQRIKPEAAAPIYQRLIAEFPSSPAHELYRARVAYIASADDLEPLTRLVDDRNPIDPATSPSIAVVAAWLRLRQGQPAAARAALFTAARRWDLPADLGDLGREVILFTALTGGEIADTAATLDAARIPWSPLSLAAELLTLGQRQLALAALDLVGADAPPLTLARANLQRFEIQKSQGFEVAALLAASAAAEAAGPDGAPLREAITKAAIELASYGAAVYQRTTDSRYGEAAVQLLRLRLAGLDGASILGDETTAKLEASADALERKLHGARERPEETAPKLWRPGDRIFLSTGLIRTSAVNRETLFWAFRHRMPELADCYRRAQITSPTLEGKIRVQLQVGSDGSIVAARTDQNTANAELGRCVIAVAETLPFPNPGEGQQVMVSYPLVFRQ